MSLTPRWYLLLTILLLLALAVLPARAEQPQVWLLQLEGAIGPASSDYITRNLAEAESAGVDLFVIRLDTPGGLDKSMRDIIKRILDADVPVATWVAPGGSRAASAGTYILYASHIAAMAPATNLGAATPVAVGGGGGNPLPIPDEDSDDSNGSDAVEESEQAGTDEATEEAESPAAEPERREEGSDGGLSASELKAINDAVAYIRSLADLRGRNADWAEAAVRGAESLGAREALEKNVIDLVARDLDDLLAQLEGREVELERRTVTLALEGAEVREIEPDWRSEFLALITDPNIAYILLMIGIYGLILEFYNPGLGIPGVTGVICLLLAFYALQMLPVSYVGVALIVIGIGLMITEAFAPSFGVFGIGGVIAFAFGSVLLMDSDLPGYQISMPIIAAFVVASAAIFIFSVGAALRARRGRVVSGAEALVGAAAVALEDFEQHGRVRAEGEVWQADTATPVRRGQRLKVTELHGLSLTVEPETASVSESAPRGGH